MPNRLRRRRQCTPFLVFSTAVSAVLALPFGGNRSHTPRPSGIDVTTPFALRAWVLTVFISLASLYSFPRRLVYIPRLGEPFWPPSVFINFETDTSLVLLIAAR